HPRLDHRLHDGVHPPRRRVARRLGRDGHRAPLPVRTGRWVTAMRREVAAPSAVAGIEARRLRGRLGHATFWTVMWTLGLGALLYLLLPTLIIVAASLPARDHIASPPHALPARGLDALGARDGARLAPARRVLRALPAPA